jgi:hypothetical protein
LYGMMERTTLRLCGLIGISSGLFPSVTCRSALHVNGCCGVFTCVMICAEIIDVVMGNPRNMGARDQATTTALPPFSPFFVSLLFSSRPSSAERLVLLSKALVGFVAQRTITATYAHSTTRYLKGCLPSSLTISLLYCQLFRTGSIAMATNTYRNADSTITFVSSECFTGARWLPS